MSDVLPLGREIVLLFPHHLFTAHPGFSEKSRVVVFVEDSLFFEDPSYPIKNHRQRLVLHRASMREFGRQLEEAGHEVRFLDFQRGVRAEGLLAQLAGSGVEAAHVLEFDDFILAKRVRAWALASGIRLELHTSPGFVTPPDWAEEQFAKRKKPFMAAFYEAQRKRMGILVDADGAPEGGRWSYDDENRLSMPKRKVPTFPQEPFQAQGNSVKEAITYVAEHFPEARGSAENFAYPVTHAQAAEWLERFLVERFAGFGPYEDAVSGRERVLFHSILTPSLNIGLLTPQQVIDRALAFASENEVPLNSLEGFVRQIIGWREFMRCMYHRHGVEMRNSNFWGFEDRPVPAAFYDGTTGIEPIDTTIRRLHDHAYCHHIERLMLLGNFMLLCRVHPRRVCDWFMEMFIDAYDWVMVPNVFGMSQFAVGGMFTTKPYLSGSNYVKKMSDYKAGEWCVTWDGLFWSFIDDHSDFFRSQYRLAMMAKNLDRMGAEKLATHRAAADAFMNRLWG